MTQILKDIFVSRNLNNIQRYSLVRTNKPQSVAEHSYNVSILSSIVFKFLKSYFSSISEYNNILSIGELYLLKACLFHDMGESVTGDIVYTFKNSGNFLHSGECNYILDSFKDSCFSNELPLLMDFSSNSEEKNSRFNYFCSLIPNNTELDISRYFQIEKFVDDLDLIIKFCDYLELLFYTFEEIKSGNSFIRPIANSGIKIITDSKFSFIFENSETVCIIVKELIQELGE